MEIDDFDNDSENLDLNQTNNLHTEQTFESHHLSGIENLNSYNPNNYALNLNQNRGAENYESYLDELSNYQYSELDQYVTSNDSELIGNPTNDGFYWQEQTTAFTCAVQAQRGIIELFTGKSVSEAELTYHATANGWLNENGMSPVNASKLLEMYGVDTTTNWNATVEDLVNDLSQGKRVIVGVNAEMLSTESQVLNPFFKQVADHAIWVTGIDANHPDGPHVIINDSGIENGSGVSYPLKHFVDSWETSGFLTISTVDAPPEFTLYSGHFNSETQRIEEIVEYLDNKGIELSFNDSLQPEANYSDLEKYLTNLDDSQFNSFIKNI